MGIPRLHTCVQNAMVSHQACWHLVVRHFLEQLQSCTHLAVCQVALHDGVVTHNICMTILFGHVEIAQRRFHVTTLHRCFQNAVVHQGVEGSLALLHLVEDSDCSSQIP